ncbi:MAG: hypothetical protein OXG49_09350 [Chloroflexi bacterium]|nr:hypothetical protein [Chloroflexota bacterium]
MELGPLCLTIFVIAMIIGGVYRIYEWASNAWLDARLKGELEEFEKNTLRDKKLDLLGQAKEHNRLRRQMKGRRKRH